MSDKQLSQVQAQLPAGAQILRMYRAFEGDLRVIAKPPGLATEVRYSVRFEVVYPAMTLLP
jgi:hypothetical protein